ncbi:MAG: MBOAT family protein [Bryobacterales bacterium]|nr:MBOAT family protein [Bryobacterales bacterium]
MSLFTSAYFVLLACVFFLYWPLARWRLPGLAVLLFANYFFLARGDLVYLWLIPAASLVDYLIGSALGGTTSVWLRRLLTALSVLLNVSLILASKISGAPIVLPLSLSFYAFQSLTYTLDIARKDASPSPSLLAHLTATCFFPTFLAGPITRVSSLIPQLQKAGKALDPADGGRALFLIGLGLVKKLLIADYLAENFVNRVFDFPNLYTGLEALLAVYAYAVQLYYDFSGYTDIAIGSALLLGIRLPANFNAPYSAVNIADFWRRWHITLSNWLRDYLYFSLPGQRRKVFPYLNLVITMALGGIWHGLTFNFLIWGLLHGVGLVAVRLAEARRGRRPSRIPHVLRVFLTVQFVCFAWIFFRASTLENALAMLTRIGSLTASLANVSVPLAVVLSIGILAHYIPKNWFEKLRDLFARAPFYAQAGALALLALAINYVASTGAAPFIYTKF